MNGQWVPEGDLKVSAWDLATMQAASCFEMCRSFKHKHFKLREHLDRLRQSCTLTSIPLPEDFDNLEAICEEVTERNPLPPDQEHRLLIVVNAGAAPMYREIEGVIPHSYFYVATFPLRFTVAGMGKYFTEGVHAVTSPILHVSEQSIPAQAKHRSRLHFHLAQQKAGDKWAILTDRSAWLEAPGANIVSVRDDTLYLYRRNALRGISLATVEQLAREMGWRVRESEDWHTEPERMEEVWLTCTPLCLVPVVSVDGKPVGNGTIGPRYQRILQAWSESVGVNIAEQIIGWEKRLL